MKDATTIGLALVLAAACNGRNASTASPPDAEPPPVLSAAVEAPDAAPTPDAAASAGLSAPPMHRRGLVGIFFKAAQDADLSDDQKTAIAKLEEPLQADAGMHKEMAALHSDIVASLKDGKMDASKIAGDEAAISKALSARAEEQATALRGLHDVLTPAQRGAVADAVRASRSHPPAAPPANAADWATRRLDRMKSQLVLDPEQQKQVAALLARGGPTPASVQTHAEAMKKQTETVAAAFETDAFDAKKVDLASVPGQKPIESFDREVRYVGQLMPILTPGQRDRFASLMEHPRDRGGHGGDSITEAPDPAGGAR